jgi:hypothetical protein
MMAARSTDGSEPTIAANPITTTMATTAAVRRVTRAISATAKTAEAISATLKPETARM